MKEFGKILMGPFQISLPNRAKPDRHLTNYKSKFYNFFEQFVKFRTYKVNPSHNINEKYKPKPYPV